MKTGIVMEINDDYAIIMGKNGNFKKVKLEQGWKIGDVVFLHKKKTKTIYQWIAAGAACFVLFMVTMFGYGSYYDKETIISLDVNPSIELTVNRWNRVIDAAAYNQEGEMVLSKVKINNKSMEKAICLLLSSGLEDYIQDSSDILCTVQTESKKGTLGIKEKLQESLNSCLEGFRDNYHLEIYGVEADTLENAHKYHTTAGKYMTVMELKKVMPEADIDQYSRCTIGEIREEIDRCNLAQEENENQEDSKEQTSEDEKENQEKDENGSQNGNGNQNGAGSQRHGHCD